MQAVSSLLDAWAEHPGLKFRDQPPSPSLQLQEKVEDVPTSPGTILHAARKQWERQNHRNTALLLTPIVRNNNIVTYFHLVKAGVSFSCWRNANI